MVVYQDEHGVTVDASLNVPVVLTITNNNKEYRYQLDGTALDNCPYDADIKPWIKKARLQLNEIIWAYNEHRQPNPITITTPLNLKLKLRFNKNN